jgi:hypothetical protein
MHQTVEKTKKDNEIYLSIDRVPCKGCHNHISYIYKPNHSQKCFNIATCGVNPFLL